MTNTKPERGPPSAEGLNDVAQFIAEAQRTIHLIRTKLLGPESQHGQSDTVPRG